LRTKRTKGAGFTSAPKGERRGKTRKGEFFVKKSLKFVLVSLLFLTLACALFLYFASDRSDKEDHQLTIEQSFVYSEPTDIVKATFTLTWEQGKIVSGRHVDEYQSEQAAQAMYDSLSAEFLAVSEEHLEARKLTVHENIVEYDEGPPFRLWDGMTYKQVKRAYAKRSDWNVVQEGQE